MYSIKELVRFLGSALGVAIREQGGQQIFELEEDIRKTARELRRSFSAETAERLIQLTSNLEQRTAFSVLRAFTLFFQLVNLAEQHDTARRSRSDNGVPSCPRSLREAVDRLRANGLSNAGIMSLLDRIEVVPVFTAHPTEAKRRTVLEALLRVRDCLEGLDLARPGSEGSSRFESRILAELTTLWQTDEIRAVKPTVLDEVRNGLFYFEQVLFDLVPEIYRELASAIGSTPSEIPPILHFGSWIGGDRDGNDFVTADLTREALRMHKLVVLQLYLERVERLARILSQSTKRIGVMAELTASVAADKAAWPEWRNAVSEHQAFEPYRQKLAIMRKRLIATQAACRRAFNGQSAEEARGQYASAADFLAELELIAESLKKNRAGRVVEEYVQPLITQVRVFGFYIASLDVRQHSLRHSAAMAEILASLGEKQDYSGWAEAEKVRFLTAELLSKRPLIPLDAEYAPTTWAVLETFDAIRDVLLRISPGAVYSYIISMAEGVSDVLEVLVFAKEAGLYRLAAPGEAKSLIRIIPLFETLEDLRNAPQILEELFRNEAYELHLRAQGNLQEVMIGYSDSNKDGGYLASHWALHQVQQKIRQVATRCGKEIRIFHGRGGTTSRGGGGPLNRAILAQPAGTVTRGLRVTEQGEVLAANYTNREIAQRNLEEMINAVIISASRSAEEEPGEDWAAVMEQLAHRAAEAYRTLVYKNQRFMTFFKYATPISELSTLNIGSRPSRRSSSDSIEDLRAIPWVFSWNQNRCLLPTWYGVGTALDYHLRQAPDGEAQLRRMYQEWPFFQNVVANCEMTLAKADMQILEQYCALVPDQQVKDEIFPLLAEEFERTCAAVIRIVGETALLEQNPGLREVLQLRRHYLDPLNYIQIDLLRRLRDPAIGEREKRQLLQAVQLSINGIASGMKNTG